MFALEHLNKQAVCVCESNKPDCPGLLRHWASKSTPSPPWLHDANVFAVQRPLDDRVREQDGLASACITGGVRCAAMAVAQSLQNRRGWRGGKQVFNLGQQ